MLESGNIGHFNRKTGTGIDWENGVKDTSG